MTATLRDLRRGLLLRQAILLALLVTALGVFLPELSSLLSRCIFGIAAAALAAALGVADLDRTLLRAVRRITEQVSRTAGRHPGPSPARAAEALGHLERALEAFGGDIVQSQRTSREFLSAVAHQLSQPLTALRGTLELALMKRAEAADSRRTFQDALDQADRIVQLTRSLRELAEAEQSWDPGKQTPLSVVLGEVTLDMRPVAEAQHVRLEVSGPGEVYVTANPQRLQQAILYLIGHAIQQAEENGAVQVTLEGFENDVLLRIGRSGKAYRPEQMDGLFEPFRHTRGASEEEEQDRMRLAIARRIIEAARGSISVENGAGKTEFQVILPRSPK